MTGLAALCSPVLAWASAWNMPVGVTTISPKVHNLHMTVFWICVVIGVLVFGVMLYSLVKHRKAAGHQAVHFHESTTVEIIWTIIPFIILIAMAIPATRVLIQMNHTQDSALTIKATGYQWKWHYDYVGEGVSYFSNLATPTDQITNKAPKGEHYLLEVDNHLVVPVGKKIRILTTANDVIHAWWVPALAIKKDAVPGFINESWAIIEKPGIYRGQCAELCGVYHGYMPIVVEAVDDATYAAWLQEKKAALAPKPTAAPAAK